MSDNNMSDNKKTRVLVVGGGFGGVKAALELDKCGDCEVTLLSDHGHFRYYPGLYKTATGGKRVGARIRLSDILEGSSVKFVRSTAAKLDRAEQRVIADDGKKYGYDKLILALGNVTNYFGIDGLKEHSYGIKSSEEAERFKKHLHEQFIEHGCPDLNYIIVGGGPTGIELAGALPGYIRKVMERHGVADCKLNVSLIEALPKLLPRAPKDVSAAVTKRLKQLGVDIYLGMAVKGQAADKLMMDGKDLPSHTVVWTAGVTNHPFFKENNFKLTERGKVEVNEYLEAEPNIYVLGDNANTQFSGMAQTALHDGDFVAENLVRELDGKPAEKYVPKQPITVIPVGPRWASVQWGKRRFTGWIGWILRELADLVAFHDLQSWAKAGNQWIKGLSEEDLDCPSCSNKK